MKAKSTKAICVVNKKKPTIKVLEVLPSKEKKNLILEKDEKIINVEIREI